MSTGHLFGTGNSNLKYYASMNKTFQQLFGKSLMLHYPLFIEDGESLEQRQINLTNYCTGKSGESTGKTILEVGCGNGTQSVYLARHMKPASMIGIDLIPENIELANGQEIIDLPVTFRVDDAQNLDTVSDDYIDILFCIESAFHYPDKEKFLKQVQRVLKQGGKFIIADIINKKAGRTYITARWKRKMSYYHWTEQQYRFAITGAGLKIEYEENLTDAILKGYEGYEHWVRREMISSLFRFLLFRLFAFIQININTHLLKKKEDYYLVVGSKP
jgi:ubiquinone/menaquinone biosynthesis C-methylase UbiE